MFSPKDVYIHTLVPLYFFPGLGCSLEYFAETDEMCEAIGGLRVTAQDDMKREVLYQRVSTILGYYQEQPHMLDPHLTGWMSKLVEAVLAMGAGSDSEKGEDEKELKIRERHAHAAAYIAQQVCGNVKHVNVKFLKLQTCARETEMS